MKKQTNKQIFKSVLLLLSVLLLVAGAAVGAFANTTETRTLALTFDANVEKCVVEIEDPATGMWVVHENVTQSGEVSIPYNAKIRLTVVPVIGKWPTLVREGGSIAVENDNVIQWSSYKEDSSVSITCEERVYTIHALNYNAKNEMLEYDVEDSVNWHVQQLTDGSITYQYGAEPLTELPAVEMEDYIFGGWLIKMGEGVDDIVPIAKDPEDGKYYIPKDLTRTKYFDNNNGTIYVYPDMHPIEYPVYREDRVFNENISGNLGELLFGAVEQMAPVKYTLSAMEKNFWKDDPAESYKSYKGYLCMTDRDSSLTVSEPSPENPYRNTVYRFYMPIVYTLTYNLNDGNDETTVFNGPETYTYATPTTIGIPSRTGYTFVKWNVEIYNAAANEWVSAPELTGEGCTLGDKKASYDATTRNDPNAVYASDAQTDGTYEIRLTAEWSANQYEITYDWSADADLIQNKGDLPTSFTFDALCAIPNPVRAGYTFTGWTLTYTDGSEVVGENGLTELEGGYQLNGSLHAKHITLTANWTVESYKVELDTDGTVVGEISGVEYDQKMPTDPVEVPVKFGYNFKGYFSAPNGAGEMYIDETGAPADKVWKIDGGENGATIKLYACWERKPVSITVLPLEKVPEGVTVTVFDVENNKTYPCTPGTPITLLYDTEFYVKITMPDGFKVVEWNGVSVDVHSDNVFLSAVQRIETEDDIVLTAMARPDAPGIGAGEDVDSIIIESDTSIRVNFTDADVASRYEVAISRVNDAAGLDPDAWKQIVGGEKHYLFTELDPGTIYYVFIRLKETDETHSGIPAVKEELTRYDAYVNETIDRLNGLFTEGDGDITKAVIQDTVNKIEALRNTDPLPTDFYEQIEALVAAIEEKLVFARLQDAKIAALEAFLTDCFKSGSFSEDNKSLLGTLCQTAVADISVATTPEDVEAIYSTARAAMEAVPVTYLYDASGKMQLTTLLGLDQSSDIALNSIQDIKTLRRAIADAIAQGKITADSFITVEEAKELLRTLDTVSAYSFYLINVQPANGDTFTLTLTIPEALAGRTGLQVAYYNAATGMVELLQTTVDGNKLIFQAKQITDFVILADPTVELTGVIIALGIIVLCQLIAIALVLVARSKAKNAVSHASVALPMFFLTIHFLPVNAELIALGLGIAALILQIVLMWLLLSSGMIRVFKTKRHESDRREVTAVVREEDLHEDPAAVFDEADESVEEPVADEAPVTDGEHADEESVEEPVEAESVLDDETFDQELADEVAEELERERAEAEADTDVTEEAVADELEEVYEDEEHIAEETFAEDTVDEEIEEVYDDEEFIEHTAEPYYSLDEEEDVYADIQEETERVSDVDTADQETEETPYGGDPLDGVFGEADVQDGTAGDERERSFYEDAYGESYEYGDEADATYAETEVADRKETGGQGSVDATAYFINDTEELSEEEEMYQYDE